MRPTILLLPLLLLPAVPAQAMTLRDALAQTWETNPRLDSARANLRALGEDIAQARALGRPSADASAGFNQAFSDPRFAEGGRNIVASLGADLPLFRGGLIGSSIGAATERVSAGRYDLESLENQILLEAATAYEDVRRDSKVVALNRNNVRVLEEQLRASRDRFEVGDLTRTDVAQSQARLARAQSQLRQAEAQLVASREAFTRTVGAAPLALSPPPPLGTLPETPAQAVALAIAGNPDLLAARADDRAAGFDVGVARAARRPSVIANAGVGYQNFLGSRDEALGLPSGSVDNQFTSQSVGITLTVPLFQGGAATSRIRESQARRSQATLAIANTERLVTEEARNALERLQAARSVTASARVQVEANELALEGVRAENSVGLRTVLDVLDAEQELLNSRVELVRAERDAFVAAFALLAALGRADAEDLALEVGRAAGLREPPVAP